jgi:hypothetical protein
MGEIEVKSESTTLIKWKLTNFSTIAARDDPKKILFSKEFQLDSSSIKCCLKFEPTTRDPDEYKKYSSIFLYIRDFAGQSYIRLRYKFWIENELGEKIRDSVGKYF